MRKIGILTFHKSINYGAFMQAYALSSKIAQEFPECKVEIIDYVTETTMNHYSTSWIKSLNYSEGFRSKIKFIVKSLLNPEQLREKRDLNKAFTSVYSKLLLSEESLVTDDLEQASRWINSRYDIIIVGSDCVFETIGYPFPNLYFLKDVKNVVKMSYAATVDRLYFETTENKKCEYIKEALTDFAYRGVRDCSTENFLHHCGLDYRHNCDPTLLLNPEDIPVEMNRINVLFEKAGITKDKIIIGMMGSNKYCQAIKEQYGDMCKIVSLYGNYRNADLYIPDLNPFEWAAIFSKFDLTVSTLFHGSILSLVNGTPTVAVDNWYTLGDDHITKIDDLYTRLSLKNHYIKCGGEFSKEHKKQLCDKVEYFLNNPDKDAICDGILKERTSFDGFLKELKAQIAK